MYDVWYFATGNFLVTVPFGCEFDRLLMYFLSILTDVFAKVWEKVRPDNGCFGKKTSSN
jgi:hypothetical protein